MIVREFIWDNGKKARLGDYQYVGIKAWRSKLESGKSKFIGFRWVSSVGGTSRYVQKYPDSDLPVFIGDKEHSKLYKKGKLRVLYAKDGETEVLYLDEAGLLRESPKVSDFLESNRGKYVLLQGVTGSAKLSGLEEQVFRLSDDEDYTLNRARNRLTDEDCTISEVREDGLYVTGLRTSVTGVCKVNPRANHIYLEDIGASGVKVLDLSGCKELKDGKLSLKGAESFSYIAPLIDSSVAGRGIRLEIGNCKALKFIGRELVFDDFSVYGSGVSGFTGVTARRVSLVGVTGLSAVSVVARENFTMTSCDVERLRVTAAQSLQILDCQRLKELYIEVDTLRINKLAQIVCNCRGLERVVIDANKVVYETYANEAGNPIITATFGSVSLKRLELNIKNKVSIGVMPVPSGFVIGYDSKTEVICNTERLREYFKPVNFSEGIQNLLCASLFARLFYVKDKVTVKFESLISKGMIAGNPLFIDDVFKIPSEVEALSGGLGGFPIRGLHISSKLEVGDNVFKRTGISKITGSEYLTSIGALAFAGTKIKSLSLGKEAKLGEFAFGGCENLTSVDGLWDIKGMKRTAFALCNSLDSDTLSVLYRKQCYMSTEELLSEYPEKAYNKYVAREIDDVITKDDCKYTKRLIALRIGEAEIARFMIEKGVSNEEKKGLRRLMTDIGGIYYTYGEKSPSAGAIFYKVSLGDTERLIYSLKRVLEL